MLVGAAASGDDAALIGAMHSIGASKAAAATMTDRIVRGLLIRMIAPCAVFLYLRILLASVKKCLVAAATLLLPKPTV